MLSAVAARKARLQSQSTSQSVSPAPEPSLPPILPQEEVRNATKRKSSTTVTSKPATQKKRKRTHRTQDEKSVRYFQEDPLKDQQDVVILDLVSDDEDVEELSGDDVSSDEPSASFIPKAPVAPQRKRAWSPSIPFESSNDVTEGFTAGAVVQEVVEPLSTFHPAPGTNAFKLSSEETDLTLGSRAVSASVLIFKPRERLALLGTYKLYVLRGAVSIAGVTLHPSTQAHNIFAPRSSPIPIIESVPPSGVPGSIPLVLPPRIRNIIEEAETAILIQELQTGVSGLGKVCGVFEKNFQPLRWQDNAASTDVGIPGVQNLTRQSSDVYPMIIPESWERALSTIEPSSDGQHHLAASGRCTYIVRGAKKSGKSTFARTLLNRLTTHYRYVAFLECDLGQSEFTPGGMVALNIVSSPLFGPPFTHPSVPYQAHYIGATSPRSSPSHYLDAIQALLRAYELDVQHAGLTHDHNNDQDGRIIDIVPLVVNTMGWTKGLGADLCRKIEDTLQPSMIFDILNPAVDESYLSGRSSETDTSFNTHVVDAIPPTLVTSRHSAADLRQLSILSYFHAIFPNISTPRNLPSAVATAWSTSLPLCAQLPYQLDTSTALDMIVLSGVGSEDVVPSEVYHVLNGAIVALVSCEPDTLDFDDTQKEAEDTIARLPYSQGAAPPSPSTSTCLGLALVRSVSTLSSLEPAQLQIVTSVPPSLLASIPPRVIVKGEMELPIWGFLDFRNEGRVAGVPKTQVPYLRWGKGEGLGGEKRRTRRNLMRKGQA